MKFVHANWFLESGEHARVSKSRNSEGEGMRRRLGREENRIKLYNKRPEVIKIGRGYLLSIIETVTSSNFYRLWPFNYNNLR